MAINIKEYVDISTTFPSNNTAERAFGGLAFTATTTPAITDDNAVGYSAYTKLSANGVAYMTLDEVGAIYGVNSPEYRFAIGYYSYLSPSGRFASKLAFSTIQDGETPEQALKRVDETPDFSGFGSFTFLSLGGDGSSSDSSADESSDIDALLNCANYNQTQLACKYLMVVNRKRGTLAAETVKEEAEKFSKIKGVCFVSGESEVSGYMPMAILGSTDYSDGQVVNFMFKIFSGETPTVSDDTTYQDFNKSFINFYGRTQLNGQTMDFYQRGFNTDGTDTAVFCNEMWFKSACETALVNMLVGRERLSADAQGVDAVKLEVIDCCAAAVRNGMFMQKELTGKDLRTIREIISASDGDSLDVDSIEADISSKGYSVYAYLGEDDHDGEWPQKEKCIVYYVFYGTADSVRFIKGTNVLL